MHEEQGSNQVFTLSIELPEMLAETLGYGGQAHTVGFYWGADEAYYNDGQTSGGMGCLPDICPSSLDRS